MIESYKQLFEEVKRKGCPYIDEWPSDAYVGYYMCTTISLIRYWLEYAHKIKLYVVHNTNGKDTYEIFYYHSEEGKWNRIGCVTSFDSYTEAFANGIATALDLVPHQGSTHERSDATAAI